MSEEKTTTTYEAWLTDSPSSLKVRVVEVEAASEPEAYRKAQAACTESEFVRGVAERVS